MSLFRLVKGASSSHPHQEEADKLAPPVQPPSEKSQGNLEAASVSVGHFRVSSNHPPVPIHYKDAGDLTVDAKPGDIIITLYQGRTFVKEYREIKLDKDKSVVLENLPETLRKGSITFRSIDDPTAKVISQQVNTRVTPDLASLLLKNTKKSINVQNQTHGLSVSGTQLSGMMTHKGLTQINFNKTKKEEHVGPISNNDVLVHNGSGVVAVPFLRDSVYSFPELPPLSTHVRWTIDSQKDTHFTEILYECSGVTWKNNFNGIINASSTMMRLSGRYKFTNATDLEFKSARVVIGTQSLLDTTNSQSKSNKNRNRKKYYSSDSEGESHSTGFLSLAKSKGRISKPREFDNVTYIAPRQVTLASNQTIQETVFDVHIPIKYVHLVTALPFIFDGKIFLDEYPVTLASTVTPVIIFKNTKANGLGISMPLGKFRIVRDDGEVVLPLENAFTSLELDEDVDTVTFHAGKPSSFVTVQRKRIDLKVDMKQRIIRESFEIILQNTGRSDLWDLEVEETLPRWSEWELTGGAVVTNNRSLKKEREVSTATVEVPRAHEVLCEHHDKLHGVRFITKCVPEKMTVTIAYTVVYVNF